MSDPLCPRCGGGLESVAQEIDKYLGEIAQEAHEALQVGGYIPTGDDDEAPGVTLGMLRRWLDALIDDENLNSER